MTTTGIVGKTAEDLEARATTVTPEETAARLGVQPSTLANWRWSGHGPPHIKVGGRVRYRIVDIADGLDSHARSSTSDHAMRHRAE